MDFLLEIVWIGHFYQAWCIWGAIFVSDIFESFLILYFAETLISYCSRGHGWMLVLLIWYNERQSPWKLWICWGKTSFSSVHFILTKMFVVWVGPRFGHDVGFIISMTFRLLRDPSFVSTQRQDVFQCPALEICVSNYVGGSNLASLMSI